MNGGVQGVGTNWTGVGWDKVFGTLRGGNAVVDQEESGDSDVILNPTGDFHPIVDDGKGVKGHLFR